MSVTLRPQQITACADIDRLFNMGHKNVLGVLPTGVGKCHGIDTPILMYDGTIKKVQDVQLGDVLIGPDSKKRIVLSLARGREMLYKVTPVKGEPYVVNESHILSLKQTGLKKNPLYNCQKGKGTIVNISVKEYLESSKNFKHTHKGWRTGVNFKGNGEIDNVYLPPYLLGVWLGDGSSNQSHITSADVEIIDYIYEFASVTEQTVSVTEQLNNKSSVYKIVSNNRRKNTTQQSLRKFDLINNKHIPIEYKTSSRENRLELLAGILDSDGHLTKTKCYDVVFKIEDLAKDLVYLVRSLGLAAYMKPCRKKCHNTGVTGDYFRVQISGDLNLIPTKLKRHKPDVRLQSKSVLVTGITVEPIGVGDYYGFEITGDNLYLLGDFTVTHNTIVKAEYARRNFANGVFTVILAHRDVLLGQISRACCMLGVSHSFICSDKTVGQITNANRAEFGDSFHNQYSSVVIVSVDTFLARLKDSKIPDAFLQRVGFWMLDESHHLTQGSKWGKCIESFPNARGLGVTATPIRGDLKGLGAHADGYFNAMSVTTNMLESIKLGSLTPYKILAPDTIDTRGIKKNKDGDYNTNELYIRTKEAGITGSAVEHYLKYLRGKPVITFGVNIQHCKEICKEFIDAGVPSRVMSAKNSPAERDQATKDLISGVIMNLINCDLFGEGYDAPAVMGVIMLRRTESYSLYKQQFGRMLRTANGKVYGILLDHVGNTKFFMEKYGLSSPHDDPEWTLDRIDRKKKREANEDDTGAIETITCGACGLFGIMKPEDYVPELAESGVLFIGGVCPDCGHSETDEEKDARKREIKIKEGNLVELSFDVIESLIQQRDKALMPVSDFRKTLGNAHYLHAAVNNHANRQGALNILRHWIQEWCRMKYETSGQSVTNVQLDFELTFGINVFKAQAETASKMAELSARIEYQTKQMYAEVS